MKTNPIYQSRRHNKYLSAVLCLLFFSICSFAQERHVVSTAEIRALLKKATDKNEEVSEPARQALSKFGAQAIPALLEIVQKGESCSERTGAADFVIDIDSENEAIVPALVEISTGRTVFSSEQDLLCRRGATFSLAFSTAGIRALTKLLRDRDLFVRQSAIFAFDELTETASYPSGSLPVMKEAIPVIVKAMKEKDKVMSEMAEEVLSQIIGRGEGELSDLAKSARERIRQ